MCKIVRPKILEITVTAPAPVNRIDKKDIDDKQIVGVTPTFCSLETGKATCEISNLTCLPRGT